MAIPMNGENPGMRNILYRFAVWLFQQKMISIRRTGLSTALACCLLMLTETALADHNEYATDHEVITIDLGDSVISFPKTQDGEPVATNYIDSLAPRGNSWISYGFTGTKPEPEERKRKVREYFAKWRTNNDGNLKPSEISFRFELPLLKEIIKEPKRLSVYRNLYQGRKRGISFRLNGLSSDIQIIQERENTLNSTRQWLKDVILPKQSDENGFTGISKADFESAQGKYQIINSGFPGSRVLADPQFLSNKNSPLIFDNECFAQAGTQPFTSIGLCRVRFWWKTDMIVTFDLASKSYSPLELKDYALDVFDALRYLEIKK